MWPNVGAVYIEVYAAEGGGRSGQKQGQRLLIGDEILPVPDVDGRPAYRLTEHNVKDGIARLTWAPGTFNDRDLHELMSAPVFAGQESWEFYRNPVLISGAFSCCCRCGKGR